jgi:SP family facilitated glucose transporter-like MFS transporter 8
MSDLDLSLAQFSLFGSLSTFGGMIGAIFSAKAASAFGHKMTLWVADLFCITGWLAISLAKDIIWLDMGRFLVGIGVGLISYVVKLFPEKMTKKIYIYIVVTINIFCIGSCIYCRNNTQARKRGFYI